MDKSNSNIFKKMLLALAAGVLSVLGGAFMPPLLIPAAAAIGFIGNAYGTLYCGIALAVSLGGIAALLSSNVLTMLCIAGFVLLSSVTLGIGLRKRLALDLFSDLYAAKVRKRLPYRLLAVLVAFFALAALYLDTALPSLLAGKEPFAGIVELFYQLEDAYKQAGLDISSLQLSTEVLPEVFYGVLIALAEGVGFLTVVLAKWFSTKAKADVRPMAPFVRWQLPSSLRIGMPMIAAAIILMFILNYGGAETVMNTAFGLFMPLFAATGIASFIYIFSRNRPNQSVSPFAVVLMIFIICFSPFLLAGFGLVELYTGFRLKMMRVDDKIRAAFEKAEREGSSVVSVDLDDGQGPRIIAVRKKREDDPANDDFAFGEPNPPKDSGSSDKSDNDDMSKHGNSDSDKNASSDSDSNESNKAFP